MSLPKPYYEEPGITIYHADCRDVLPYLPPVDLVLTDPPYGIDGPISGMQKVRGKSEYYTDRFDDTRAYLIEAVVPVITSLRERSQAVVLTPGNRNLMLYPQPQSLGCFYQPCAVAVQTFGNLDMQPILYYGKNPTGKRLGVCLSWLVTEQPPDYGHPCTKPLKVWKKLMASVSLPKQTVLDPFMGSGTTLRAAKDLGLSAIGIEIEEKYCAIAVERLRQEVLPLSGMETTNADRAGR